MTTFYMWQFKAMEVFDLSCYLVVMLLFCLLICIKQGQSLKASA